MYSPVEGLVETAVEVDCEVTCPELFEVPWAEDVVVVGWDVTEVVVVEVVGEVVVEWLEDAEKEVVIVVEPDVTQVDEVEVLVDVDLVADVEVVDVLETVDVVVEAEVVEVVEDVCGTEVDEDVEEVVDEEVVVVVVEDPYCSQIRPLASRTSSLLIQP